MGSMTTTCTCITYHSIRRYHQKPVILREWSSQRGAHMIATKGVQINTKMKDRPTNWATDKLTHKWMGNGWRTGHTAGGWVREWVDGQ
eukprot:scaffold417874_cov18-Prasinocladus_malaysianus.AAC.1